MAKYHISFKYEGVEYPKNDENVYFVETGAEITNPRGFIDMAREFINAILEKANALGKSNHAMDIVIFNEQGNPIYDLESIEI